MKVLLIHKTQTKKILHKMSNNHKKNKEKPIIKLVFGEKLIESLNKIHEKQNQELMKIISQEYAIPLNVLLSFMYDQPIQDIELDKEVRN